MTFQKYAFISKFLIFNLVCCLPVFVFGEDAAKKDGGDAIQVFVTASRGTEENALDVPQSISSVTREEIEDHVYTDINEAIKSQPGVGLAPAEGNPNFWQQGFTLRGLGAQRVLTLTDGIRQAGQGIGYGGGNLSLYDVYGLEKIEVLRGPASVLYGTDAFGGVVNVITREPQRRDEAGSNGGMRYSFDGTRNQNRVGTYFDYGDKNMGLVLGGGYVNSDDPHIAGEDPANGGGFRGYSLNGKFDYYLENGGKFRIIGNMDTFQDVRVEDSQIPLPIATFPPPGNFTFVNSPLYFNFPIYRRSLLGAEFEVPELSSSWESFKTGLYWQQLRREFHRETAFYPQFSPGFAGPPLFVDPTATVTDARVDTFDRVNTFEWTTQSRFALGDHTLTVGSDLGYDDSRLPEVEERQVVGIAGIGPVSDGAITTVRRMRADANQTRFGVYAEDNYKAASDWEIIPGVRFDSFFVEDDISDFTDDIEEVSGSIGNVYHWSKEDSAYLNLATGLRAPDLGERFQDGIVNLGVPSRLIGKADLKPERSWSSELGAKGRHGDLSYDFATFVTAVDDYIGRRDLGVIQGLATEQYSNVGPLALYGAEGALDYAVLESTDLYVNASRTWTDSSEKIDVPSWVFNYGFRFTHPFYERFIEDVSTGLNVRSVMKSDDNTVTSGRDQFVGSSFTVVDLFLNFGLGKTPLGKGKIVSGVKNLFDRKYKEPFFDQYQPIQSLYAGLQFDW